MSFPRNLQPTNVEVKVSPKQAHTVIDFAIATTTVQTMLKATIKTINTLKTTVNIDCYFKDEDYYSAFLVIMHCKVIFFFF